MPLPCILGGFETPQKHIFFRFLQPRNKMRQKKIGNFSEKSEKIAEIWYNRLLVEISYRSPPITEISPIFRPKFQKFCSLMRINVFIFSQHGIKAIKEFENIRVRVSLCGQFRQPIQRPCHNPVVLQSSQSLTEAKPSSEYLAAGNFYQRDFPATSIPTEEHTNRSASHRSTFR